MRRGLGIAWAERVCLSESGMSCKKFGRVPNGGGLQNDGSRGSCKPVANVWVGRTSEGVVDEGVETAVTFT